MDESNREERDQLGTLAIPRSDLRGIHTHRALANFPLSGRAVHNKLVHAYALVKKAAALANRESGYLDEERALAILEACDAVARGELDEFFTVDALQGGAGTSTNMNLNEVIANLASRRGIPVHPLDHVNLHQSTNDTYPTALKVCLIGLVREGAEAAAALQGEFQRKEAEFGSIVTVGRTELQSAVPLSLGAEFSAFAEATGRDRWRLFKCEERLRVVNLGGTAVGTGLAAPRSYIFRVTDRLRELTGYPLARGENLVDQTANLDGVVETAGILQAAAANLMKTARDLRFLAHTGEIRLLPVQAGSSIMPGKVNPVICEAVIQAALKIRADVGLVAEASGLGSLQINEFLPLVADSAIESLELYGNAAALLALHVSGIRADRAVCQELLDRDPMIVTALVPRFGYEGAEKLLKEYEKSAGEGGTESLRAFLRDRMGQEIDALLSPSALAALGFPDGEGRKGRT